MGGAGGAGRECEMVVVVVLVLESVGGVGHAGFIGECACALRTWVDERGEWKGVRGVWR